MCALSILIPVYGCDSSRLQADLSAQGSALNLDMELLTADDEQLQMGRARVRNYLAERAQGRWLLFIDCDAEVDRPDYLERWLPFIHGESEAKCICGGLHHAASLPSEEVSLRWHYEHKADAHRSAEERNRQPYSHFTPFNLFIDRELFLSIRFDESCTDYGHEDTFFGAELERRGVKVLHIDNPLLHAGLEPNEVFLNKSRTALVSLKRLTANHPELASTSRLHVMFSRLEHLHLKGLLAWLFRRFGTRWEQRLVHSRCPSLSLFNRYKLCYYATL